MRTHSVENLTTSNLVLCGGQLRLPANKVSFIPDELFSHLDVEMALKNGKIRKCRAPQAPVVTVPDQPEIPVARKRGRHKRGQNDEDKDNAS
jgi:hypothetical protein